MGVPPPPPGNDRLTENLASHENAFTIAFENRILRAMKTTSREEYFLAEELKDREIITQPVLHERHPYWYAQLSKRKVGEVAYWVGKKPIKTLELKRRVSRTSFQAYLSWKAAFSLFAETNYKTCRLFAWLLFCGMILNISKADP